MTVIAGSTPRERDVWRQVKTASMIAVLIGVIALLVSRLPESTFSWQGAATVGVGGALFLLLAIAWVVTRKRTVEMDRNFLLLVLVIWWFILVSEVLFPREGTIESAAEGSFSFAAYGEALTWLVAALALLICSLLRPRCLLRMFAGPFKWISLFWLCCLGSVVYSTRPMFSLVWAFKLSLIVLVLLFCAVHLTGVEEARALLKASYWGFACLALISPLAQIIVDPSQSFVDGRLEGISMSAPTLAVAAGILLLLALAMYAFERRRTTILIGVAGSVVLVLAGGKAGIAAAMVGAMLFFLLQRKYGSAFGLLAGVSFLGAVALVASPLRHYVYEYAQTEQFSTLTGRTELWAAGLQLIKESPILGHGYLTSKFVSLQFDGLTWPAGHMHNGFLEVLYNNGVIALIPFLAMNVVIIKNLSYVIRRRASSDAYIMAVAAAAIYVDSFVNGMFGAYFGGRPSSTFMLFLSLVPLSDTLKRSVEPGQETSVSERGPTEGFARNAEAGKPLGVRG